GQLKSASPDKLFKKSYWLQTDCVGSFGILTVKSSLSTLEREQRNESCVYPLLSPAESFPPQTVRPCLSPKNMCNVWSSFCGSNIPSLNLITISSLYVLNSESAQPLEISNNKRQKKKKHKTN